MKKSLYKLSLFVLPMIFVTTVLALPPDELALQCDPITDATNSRVHVTNCSSDHGGSYMNVTLFRDSQYPDECNRPEKLAATNAVLRLCCKDLHPGHIEKTGKKYVLADYCKHVIVSPGLIYRLVAVY